VNKEMDVLDPVGLVVGSERLTAIFGRWPSFHDAEVVSMRLERRGRDQWEGPVLYISVHVFEGYRPSDRSSEVKWRNHTVVTLRFVSVVDLSLADFNQQNCLMDLTFEPGLRKSEDVTWVGPAYRVSLPSSFGANCSFVCRSAEIDNVERTCPQGSVYA